MKVLMGGILALALVIGGYSIVNYQHIKNLYTKPNKVTNEVIQEALHDKLSSNNVISDKEFKHIKSGWDFHNNGVVEPIVWEKFKEFIQSCNKPSYTIIYQNGSAPYKYMKQHYKTDYRFINIYCEYNEDGDYEMMDSITVLLNNLEGSWKMVGWN